MVANASRFRSFRRSLSVVVLFASWMLGCSAEPQGASNAEGGDDSGIAGEDSEEGAKDADAEDDAISSDSGVASSGDEDMFPLPFRSQNRIAVYDDITCAISESGDVACWDDRGKSGTFTPLRGQFMKIAMSEQAGENIFVCGLSSAGEVSCSGWNGSKVTLSDKIPAGPFVDISTSRNSQHYGSVAAVHESGRITIVDTYNPVMEIPTAAVRILRVAVNGNLACALDEEQSIRCWYLDRDGAREAGTINGVFIDFVAKSGMGVCALTTEGTVSCWDSNGPEISNDRFSPLTRDFRIVQLATAHRDGVMQSMCALAENGQAFCGQFLLPPELALPREDRIVEIAPGDIHSCAIRPDRSVYCWRCGEATGCESVATLPSNFKVAP